MAKATNVKLDIQSGTTRLIFATWTWSKTYTENYKVMWYYGTGDGVWFVGSDSTTEYKQSTYTAPENAIKVKFKVKPIAKKHKVNGKDTSRWTADWSTEKILTFEDGGLSVPPVPTVTLDGLKLTASVENVDTEYKKIQFQVVKNDTTNAVDKKIDVTKLQASLTTSVAAGAEYKVRCRAIKNSFESEWSDYSANVKTQPAAPGKITECRASSSTSVHLSWNKSGTATSYEIQYTTKKEYFDTSNNVQSMTVNDGTKLHQAEVTGLETGNEYFFRVRSVNDNGTSGWTDIKSVKIGREPSPPTTWSSKTTASIGEDLSLYWVHNAEDGSNQTRARVYINSGASDETHDIFKGVSTSASTVDNTKYFETSYVSENFSFVDGDIIIVDVTHNKAADKTGFLRFSGSSSTYRVQPDGCSWEDGTRLTLVYYKGKGFMLTHQTEAPVDDENDGTFVYNLDTGAYTDGTKLKWKVATKGILNNFSSYSAERTIDLYASPSVELVCSNELTSYPYSITATVGPNTQRPVGYHISITAGMSYTTVNEVGLTTKVKEGAEVFSKYFDTSSNPLSIELLPGNIMLENNVTYMVNCTVSTNAGLVATADAEFLVQLADSDFYPNAEIGIDYSDLSAVIRPYCEDADGNELASGFTLSVYRREYDGTFTPIIIDLDKSSYIYDLHPALDYARYRIVARSTTTGSIDYYDVPGWPVGETAAVIQWNEEWHPFDTTEESALEDQTAMSTMIKLPYNLDVSDSNRIDVSHVNYIGRKHPVSYYGTHVGESSSWNVDIVKDDIETLYALRCLQKWMGDVYVREPSGSGYWATVAVSFSQKHKELTIPVTINITRVEGGA